MRVSPKFFPKPAFYHPAGRADISRSARPVLFCSADLLECGRSAPYLNNKGDKGRKQNTDEEHGHGFTGHIAE